MEQPTKDRLLGIAGLALGFLGWAGPSVVPTMPTYLSYPMVSVGAVLILYTVWHALRHAHAERTSAKMSAVPIAKSPDRGAFLPLDEAARRLYEEARRCNSMWALGCGETRRQDPTGQHAR